MWNECEGEERTIGLSILNFWLKHEMGKCHKSGNRARPLSARRTNIEMGRGKSKPTHVKESSREREQDLGR